MFHQLSWCCSAAEGIIGASLGLDRRPPFGFVALLGLIALAGMIMRNAVFLVDQIEADVSEGFSRREAIVEATVRRARPVVLTALAAILAMIPLSRSAFWGLMAITIMGGLFVATFLTLLFLPSLYALWYRKRLDECGSDASHLRVPLQRLQPSAAIASPGRSRMRTPLKEPGMSDVTDYHRNGRARARSCDCRAPVSRDRLPEDDGGGYREGAAHEPSQCLPFLQTPKSQSISESHSGSWGRWRSNLKVIAKTEAPPNGFVSF